MPGWYHLFIKMEIRENEICPKKFAHFSRGATSSEGALCVGFPFDGWVGLTDALVSN